MSTTADDVRTYHISPCRRSVVCWLFGPILLGAVGLWIFQGSKGLTPAILMWLAFLPLALGIQWLIDRARLEISTTGVRLRQTGYILDTPWANIIEMRLDRGREGFVTRLAVGGKGAELLAAASGVGLWGASIYDDEQRALIREHRLIPIEAFAWHLRHGALRREIEGHAPHLQPILAALDAPATPRQRQKTSSRPLTGEEWRFIALLAAFAGGVFWLVTRPGLNRPLVESGGSSVAIAAVAFRMILGARNCFHRRLWFASAGLALVGGATALWAFAVGSQFVKLLGLSRQAMLTIGILIPASLTLLTAFGMWNAFRRKARFAGVLLALLTAFFAMWAFGAWLEMSKS